MASPSNGFPIPEGWRLVKKTKSNGEVQKYYTNELGQQFHTEAYLMRYVSYARRAKVSIYSPDFKSSWLKKSSTGVSGSKSQDDAKNEHQ